MIVELVAAVKKLKLSDLPSRMPLPLKNFSKFTDWVPKFSYIFDIAFHNV